MKSRERVGQLSACLAISVFALALLVLASAANGAQGSKSKPASPKASEDVSLRDDGDAPDLLYAPCLSKGVDSIIAEIRKREVDLALREQRVAERERSVVELEGLIDKRAGELDQTRMEIEDRIADWSRQGQDRVLQLSNVYSSMPANKAGKLLGKLDLDLSVSIIRGMKKKSSAGVLAAMSPDRALSVSRRMLKPLSPMTDSPASRAN
jgi:flagellar motility protein MotE (MotC chaperone)